MPEKNWEKVKDVFHEALLLQSSEREAFLDDACSGDTDLRTEVQSLLGSLNQAKNFLEMPVISQSKKTKVEWQLESGRRISHYRIVEPIGSGGMGEVYLAEDERLGRQVALKILPQNMLDDRSRLKRFEREARTVSALNHPNILTIYDLEEENGIHLFASEFVKGITLREKLDSDKLSILETLEIAIQMASALQAAHEAGVVHRDIKPENVMIREDGYVKVLDFGLAKLKEKVEATDSDRTLTQRFSLPGVIMGTVSYMSPEQARGTDIDARSDIFSLGIVMYEMLAGQPPFTGDTATDIIAGIVQTDPRPVRSLNAEIPIEFDEIVSEALSKDPIDRYQDARVLLSDLKSLLRRLEFNAELEHTARPETPSESETMKPADRVPVNRSDLSRSYLPGDLSHLVGREKEIDELTDLMIGRGVRLITLTGIGGTGKTRLAQEMCRRLDSEFSEGFVFVRLADVRDASLVAAVIAQQIGIQEIIGTPISESVKDFLNDKQMLLVIDNFEQVMDAAHFIADLLSGAPRLTTLVTSRERLNIHVEVEFNVPPLSTPHEEKSTSLEELTGFDSVMLFVERSQQANPDFRLSDENAGQIAKICSMLDGLPLAIELAAARTRVFSAEMILERLEARLAFLTGGPRDLPERQQTMRAAVEWSYDLLNEDEKLLFRRLSVFAGRFTPAAAETVASDSAADVSCKNLVDSSAAMRESVEFLDLFASLVDKNLLVRRKRGQDESTYRLLEIVREYAASVLETDDDADEIRLRHSMLYLSLAESAEPHLQTKDSAVWMGRLAEEYENLRAALEWSVRKAPPIAARLAAATRQFWLIRGHLSEALGWARAILGQDIEMLPGIRWKLLTACGNISQFQGDVTKAHEFYTEALAAARRSGNQIYVSQSLRGLGALAYVDLNFREARKLLSEALLISRKEGDAFGLAASLARLGDISNVEGDLSTARELTSEALEIFRNIGYLEGVSAKLYNLGAVVFLDGDHEAARAYFEEAHKTALDLGEKINTRLIFDGFAALAAEQGDCARAAKLSGAADNIGATIGYSIEPAEKIFRDAYLAKLRSAMTEEEFETEHEAGRKLTTEQMRELTHSDRDVKPHLEKHTSGNGRTVLLAAPGSSPGLSKSTGNIFAGAARRPKVVLAVLLLFLGAAVILAFWIWGAASDFSTIE